MPLLRTYEQIWQPDGAIWINGPGLLSQIIHYVKEKHNYFAVFPSNRGDPAHSNVTICVPMPKILDLATGRTTSIENLIPEHLRPTFAACCSAMVARRMDMISSASAMTVNRLLTPYLLERLTGFFRGYEQNAESRGEPVLWQIMAQEFGFEPNALPNPSNFATIKAIGYTDIPGAPADIP